MAENSLDLYAKIEPMIGFYEEYEELYKEYLLLLKEYKIKNILDVGCGNGNMLMHLQNIYEAKGIDISKSMVEIAIKKGANAYCIDIKDELDNYDAIIAIGDVINYFDKKYLKFFLEKVEKRLNKNGIFVCDINTPFGFEEVTAGSMSIDEDERFLSIEAEFEENILTTQITLFEKERDCYKKNSKKILQYYHSVSDIQELTNLKIQKIKDIKLFAEQSDKTILLFSKEI
jgi:cyclopropane fatty-acyl-phospholipid synthase-like methyltransferase